ncbi:uncharacterized protein LOC126265674 [Aethina tumida]|uniref:uncharacterized protein LOC126265674 n=1 Tax=Aethina tumida TaxID=116153 RepID=UPI0021475D11|nr:uncharacterized protein LOC126265674 [Aethina tumida]
MENNAFHFVNDNDDNNLESSDIIFYVIDELGLTPNNDESSVVDNDDESYNMSLHIIDEIESFAGTLDNYKEYELWNCARERVLIFPQRVPGFRSCKHSKGFYPNTELQCSSTVPVDERKIFKRVTVIAHNGQAFDHQFILNYILTKTDIKPNLIMRGTKIILAEVGFLDSLNYFPMALAKLPKAFGLAGNFKKGYFPHLFNTLENQQYVGPLPSAEFYGPNQMKPEDRHTFLNWHQEHQNDVFNFQEEIVAYCKSDVEILMTACLSFRSMLLNECKVCPFTEATTIASACNKVFARNYLEADTIAVIPRGGYRLADNQSVIALQWLLWEENVRGITIHHAGTGREHLVGGGLKVDGFNEEQRQIFEFHGCYFHGCTSCFKFHRDTSIGGGHPTIYVGSAARDIDLSTVDGMVKCKILPPTQLYHPVLPVRMKGKLMFALCNSCGESSQQRECCHTEEERLFTGTWVIAEVLKALEKGYRIVEVFEVWTYETRQYNHSAGQPGLFTEMMNKFIKIKQEASGWPADCINDVVKQQQYLVDFEEAEKVKLTPERIENNPGLRSLAKLMLNSFWGKFGQRENQPQATIVNDPQECFDLLAHPSKNVNSITPVNEQTVVINWEYADEAVESLPTVNVVIAAFVTAQARLKLYEYLEMLDTRVLYYDTDSVIYVSSIHFPDPPTGKFIGDMTDELEVYGIGSYITEFVSGGPKNYAYSVWSTTKQCIEHVCKVKGIALTYSASQLINFEKIKQMVLEKTDPIRLTSMNFVRTKDHRVVTKEETKTYRTNSIKRLFLDDNSSRPFGYKVPRN